jgi:hypothetical protein
MDIEAIRGMERITRDVQAASHHFGLGRLCRLNAVFHAIDGTYVVRMIDTRKSRFDGPVFSFRIDLTEHSSREAVRDYVKLQIAEQFGKCSGDERPSGPQA